MEDQEWWGQEKSRTACLLWRWRKQSRFYRQTAYCSSRSDCFSSWLSRWSSWWLNIHLHHQERRIFGWLRFGSCLLQRCTRHTHTCGWWRWCRDTSEVSRPRQHRFYSPAALMEALRSFWMQPQLPLCLKTCRWARQLPANTIQQVLKLTLVICVLPWLDFHRPGLTNMYSFMGKKDPEFQWMNS